MLMPLVISIVILKANEKDNDDHININEPENCYLIVLFHNVRKSVTNNITMVLNLNFYTQT